MQTINTNKLQLTALQLAYKFSLGIAHFLGRRLNNRPLASHTSIQRSESVSGIQKRHPSPLFWILVGLLGYVSVIGLMGSLSLQDCMTPHCNAITIGLTLGLAVAIVKVKPLKGSGKVAEDIPTESTTIPIYQLDTAVMEESATISPDVTKLQQIKESLEESDRQFEELIINVPGMIYQYPLPIDDSLSFPLLTSDTGKTYELEPLQIQQNTPVDRCRDSLLLEITNQIRNSLEPDTILETAVESIRNLLQIDRCNFLWYRTQKRTPYWEVVNEAKAPNLKSYIGKYRMTQVRSYAEQLLNKQIIQVDTVVTLSDSTLRKFLLALGYTSILLIPVETQSGEIGIISCGHCTGERPWNNSEVELLQALVAQLAIALNQAQLYTQAREEARVAKAQAQQLELSLKQLQATQAQLVQSEKMSSLGQLVAGIAHEINNPVNFIHGNIAYASAYFYDVWSLLRLYQEHHPNPAAAVLEHAKAINLNFIAEDLPKLLASMQRGTDRIRSIVMSLRNFSRADEADMKKADLHEGIENTLLILQHRLKSKGQQPEIQVFKDYGDLPTVECYPGQLNQVFMNILSNAIEAFQQSGVGELEQASSFIPHPPPIITIRTSLLERSDSTQNLRWRQKNSPDTLQSTQSVVIRIADNGPGMSESVKARLFDPFFTTKPVGQGSGLGLSISYQIVVEHHHGILTCTSAPGQGTEFWIEIPIQQMN